MHHQYQRHRWQICHRCRGRWYQRHRWQICHRYQRHRRQIFTPFSLALLIPTGVNNTGGKFATAVNDTGGKLPLVSTTPAANLVIMVTISGCRHFKVNLKAKIYIYVYSTTQRYPNKITKIFLLEGFFHLPPVSLTPVANLELRISPRIFEKIRNDPNGKIRGLGETDSRKKPEAKNLVTLSL